MRRDCEEHESRELPKSPAVRGSYRTDTAAARSRRDGGAPEPAPARQLTDLLARSRNPFDVSEGMLRRLERSVLHEVTALHAHPPEQRAPGRGESGLGESECGASGWGCFRHLFLTQDGSSELLWELRYPDESGSGLRCEVYERESELRQAEARTPSLLPPPQGGHPAPHSPPDDGPFTPAAATTGPPHQPGRPRCQSAEHGRRLLRRAENPDRPGGAVARLLDTAQAHEIVHAPQPYGLTPQLHLWCAVYQHTFLLADGSEVRLYELEHDLTSSGHPACEVYPDSASAARAVHRHARERGLGE